MGAWGPGPFENDAAGEWFAEFNSRDDPIAFIRETMAAVTEADGVVDVDDASWVVAAAAVVASQLPDCPPRGGASIPDDLAIEPFRPEPALLSSTATALDRVARNDSELAELWGDAGPFRAVVQQLRDAVAEPIEWPNSEAVGALPVKPRRLRKRRQRFEPGSVFRILLGDGTHTYARMLAASPFLAYHDCRSSGPDPDLREIAASPVLFVVASSYGGPGAGEDWVKIGSVSLDEVFTPIPVRFHQSVGDLRRLRMMDDQGNSRPATFEECQGLERVAVWDWSHVQERLLDHYAGRPNRTVEQLRVKIPDA